MANQLATEDDWERSINVNLNDLFFIFSRASPALKGSRRPTTSRLLAHYSPGAATRFVTPQEVVHHLAFLLSSTAAATTGAHMMLNSRLSQAINPTP